MISLAEREYSKTPRGYCALFLAGLSLDGGWLQTTERQADLEEVTFKNREDMVYQVLKKEILDLELKPGQVIKENEICERFSVSRTPVRDALRMLQEQGFVITVPYRGIYVTLLNLSNIKQMIYMRVAVETMVMRDFSQIATPLIMEDIFYMLRKQKALIQTADFKPEQFYRLDAQLHGIWFEATKKTKLWEMLQEQQLHYTRFRMLDFVTETDFTRIIEEHENLVELLEKKRIAGMEKALKDHLYFSMKRMRHQIDVEYREYFEEEDPEGKFDI